MHYFIEVNFFCFFHHTLDIMSSQSFLSHFAWQAWHHRAGGGLGLTWQGSVLSLSSVVLPSPVMLCVQRPAWCFWGMIQAFFAS